MEAIILCGGKGTRLSEETTKRPKPMVKIGGKPIIWHIMKIYNYYGVNRFILALGYKGEQIKKYFRNDINIDCDIVFADTGEETLKGGRIKRLEHYIQGEVFHLTYGDGISNINLNKLVDYHKSHYSIGTVTAVRPPSRFGELEINKQNTVLSLEEKPQMGRGLINGGFFMFNKKLFSYLTEEKNCDFEFGPLQQMAKDGELKAYKHNGFWQCMDNVRERDYLNKHIKDNTAPWVVWK